MRVPFLDLVTQYNGIREEIHEEIEHVFQSGNFILGEKVWKFEEEFARYIGVRYCVGLNSGTSALHLSLRALKIGTGDEVFIPCNTFFAVYEAIKATGAKPILVEPDPKTYTMDPDQVEKSITDRSKAILPVHLYGQAADMKPLLDLARDHQLYLIEDAAQAHGTLYSIERQNAEPDDPARIGTPPAGMPALQKVKVGSIGNAGAFSFYPGKNIGAYGEGGCVVTNDEEIAERVRMLRDHGQMRKYYHDDLGGNYRMDALQGAILRVKLKRLEEWNEKRRRWATFYNEALSSLDLVPPYEAEYGRHNYHLYVIRVKKRDELRKFLASKGIETGIHYPIPIHLQNAYAEKPGREGRFPITETLAQEILSLPLYPELTEEKAHYVVEGIRLFLSPRKAERPIRTGDSIRAGRPVSA